TLKAGSPAINKGDNNHYWDAVGEGNPLPGTESGWGLDLGSNPRLSGANIDLGAYERPVCEVPDAATLAKIGVDPGYPSDGYYIQTADIDLSDYAAGSGWVPIGGNSAPFNGTFDGNGYTIRNLKINRPDVGFVGLFGVVGSEDFLTDIRLVDAKVTGGETASSSVGNLRDGIVEQVYVRGTVSAAQSNVGGLVGVNVGTIRNSVADI